MATRTNAWITLENTRALAWWDWYQWHNGGREGDEPPLDSWGKNAIKRLGDVEFAFQAFQKATIQQREWRLFSVWDVTKQQIDAGFAQYGDAAEGGDYGVAGFWTWEDTPRSAQCKLAPHYDWHPNAVIKYIPNGVLQDVTLLAGQPVKEMPTDPITHKA